MPPLWNPVRVQQQECREGRRTQEARLPPTGPTPRRVAREGGLGAVVLSRGGMQPRQGALVRNPRLAGGGGR